MSKKTLRLLVTLAGVATALAVADDSAPDPRQLERGQSLYRIHCANCHGAEADGAGPMADLLVVSPADLTRLRSGNEGEFPAERVYRAIDGRGEIRSHGQPRMPIWGLSFQQLDRDTDQEAEVRARIVALVTYLESLQRAEGPR